MLKSIDILIGVSTVILLFSMAVTLLTQFFISLLNARGRHLCAGLADLLQQLDPAMKPLTAQQIMSVVLRHPLVADIRGRLGAVIHREEFTKILMELASGQGPQQLEPAAKAALQTALTNNGLSNPGAALNNIRQLALQLEMSNPELANDVRLNLAILHEATSDFVGKINAWFDQTIDRVRERFTVSTRAITFVSALLVAFAVQLDVIAVMNRLSLDDALRSSLVAGAEQLVKQQPGTTPGGAATAGGPAAPASTASLDKKQYYDLLATRGLIALPRSGWVEAWSWDKLPGVLIASLLLSLGAPFWYGVLKNLLQLRSVLTNKDDQQRQERQSTQAAAGTATAPTAPAVLVGERGDLSAMG